MSRTPLGLGCATWTIVAGSQPVGSDTRSVALIALLTPRVAQIVVTIALPEALDVVVQQGDLADPLRALPEVQMRHQQPHRPAVLARQRAPLVRPDDPRLAVAQVRERQVGCVAGRRGC